MTEIRMAYGRTKLWFARMPCYLDVEIVGRQMHVRVMSRRTGREVSLGIHKGREAESARSFQVLGDIFARKDEPGFEGVCSRDGKHAVMLYGVIAACRNGVEVVDVNVQGGGIAVEPDE